MVQPIIAVINDWGSVSGALREAGARVIDADNQNEVGTATRYADAIVLTGGGDVNPKRYGAERHPQVYGVDDTRDTLELQAIKLARKRGIPMMGICRGHQLLNVAHGGTLHQHLGDQPYAHFHESTEHHVKLRSGSRLGRALEVAGLLGTSLHHQAIARLGNGLVPVGWADDGTIEIIESAKGRNPYVLGTQFHPEMDYRQSRIAEAIFDFFVSVAEEATLRRGNTHARWDKVKSMAPKSRLYSGYSSYTSGHLFDHGGSEGGGNWNTDDYYDWKRDTDILWDDPDEAMKILNSQKAITDGCAFPPCQSPTDCSTYKDCGAKAIASRQAVSFNEPKKPRRRSRGSKGYRNMSGGRR